MAIVWSNRLQSWRKKEVYRSSGKPRTEKQVVLARHKQVRKSTARKLGISPTHMEWVSDRLVFAANGEPVRDALMMARVPTPRAKVIVF